MFTKIRPTQPTASTSLNKYSRWDWRKDLRRGCWFGEAHLESKVRKWRPLSLLWFVRKTFCDFKVKLLALVIFTWSTSEYLSLGGFYECSVFVLCLRTSLSQFWKPRLCYLKKPRVTVACMHTACWILTATPYLCRHGPPAKWCISWINMATTTRLFYFWKIATFVCNFVGNKRKDLNIAVICVANITGAYMKKMQ